MTRPSVTKDDAGSDEQRSRERDDDDRVVVVKKSGGITPFLVGLAVGAGLALLFAPASGAETRRRLAKSARRMTGAAADAVEDVAEKAREGISSVRDKLTVKRAGVERAMKEGRVAAKQARQDLEKRLSETKAAYQAGVRVARESKTRDD
jgi:gas vesicle protein